MGSPGLPSIHFVIKTYTEKKPGYTHCREHLRLLDTDFHRNPDSVKDFKCMLNFLDIFKSFLTKHLTTSHQGGRDTLKKSAFEKVGYETMF